MKPVVKCPECGWENRHDYTHNVPESLRCGFCNADVFLDERMAEVDRYLRRMGEARRRLSD